MKAEDVTLPVDFAPPRRRPWLTPLVVGLLSFAVTAVSVRGAVRRQAPILDSMEMQPAVAAASLAYRWGGADDAVALERRVVELAERKSAEAPPTPARGEVNYLRLRKMDADMAKFRLLSLRNAPRSEFEHLCAAATIRCTPYTLEGLITMLKKERHVWR